MEVMINPEKFDVIVTTNMFGDILADELSQITGSAYMLPSAEIDEHGKSSRKALYVAMTRTYKYLYVMYTDCLPSPLSYIDKNLYKENEVDTNTVEDW